MTNKQYPINDWEFVEDIENAFNEWFHSNHTDYSLKSEYFYGDCEIGDVKTRQDMLKNWDVLCDCPVLYHCGRLITWKNIVIYFKITTTNNIAINTKNLDNNKTLCTAAIVGRLSV